MVLAPSPSAPPAVDEGRCPRVLLVTEGTYPFHVGGVSTWSHALIATMPEVAFDLLAISAEPSTTARFDLPPNLRRFHHVPLWGLLDPAEHEVGHRRRRIATDADVDDLVPLLQTFVGEVLDPDPDVDRAAATLAALHRFLLAHDVVAAMASQRAWEAVTVTLRRCVPVATARAGYGEVTPTLHELATVHRWLAHWLFPLARPLPDVDVVHIAMAGVCSLVAVAAQQVHGIPFVLTEHGVYLRERYIAEAGSEDLVLKLVQLGFARLATRLAYAYASAVLPCCDFNRRWECHSGADASKVRTVYYGVDPADFPPGDPPMGDPPAVAWVGRINPLKDVETLVRAAAVVHEQQPEVRFHLYGDAPRADRDYLERCLALRHELGLDDVVVLRGWCDDAAAAFRAADIVVMSSISEGTPFSVLEAMLSARPVVATAVGGVPEQLGEAGLLVDPRDPQQLGAAILRLAGSPAERCRLAEAARRRALEDFSTEQAHHVHLELYRRLADGTARPSADQPHAGGERGWQRRPVALDGVVDELRGLLPLPVEVDELAAVLESRGITDRVAERRYGYPDVFSLAGDALDRLRVEHLAGAPVRTMPDRDERPLGNPVVRITNTVLLAALGPLAVLVLRAAGLLDGAATLGLTLGFVGAVLVANGFTYATVRRAAFYLAVDDATSAWRFLRDAMVVCADVVMVLTVPALVVAVLSGRPDPAATVVFAAALWVTAALWVLTAVTGALERPAPVGLYGLVGLGVAVVTGVVVASVSPAYAAVAVATGTAVALVLGGRAVHVRLQSLGVHRTAWRWLPTPAYRARESAPYALAGTLLAVLLVLPHALAWVATRWEPDPVRAFVAVEVGLMAAMVPLLGGVAAADRLLDRFWERAWVVHATATDPRDLTAALRASHDEVHLRFAAWYLVGGAGVLGVMAALGATTTWLDDQAGLVVTATLVGLAGFLLIGLAELDVLVCLAFAMPRRAVVIAGRGIGVGLLVLLPLLVVPHPLVTSVAFVAAGVAAGVVARREMAAVLRHADHYYATSF